MLRILMILILLTSIASSQTDRATSPSLMEETKKALESYEKATDTINLREWDTNYGFNRSMLASLDGIREHVAKAQKLIGAFDGKSSQSDLQLLEIYSTVMLANESASSLAILSARYNSQAETHRLLLESRKALGAAAVKLYTAIGARFVILRLKEGCEKKSSTNSTWPATIIYVDLPAIAGGFEARISDQSNTS